MGMRLNVSAQSIKEMETREMNGSITLKSLREAAAAMNMKLVYGLVPVDESIESMIEKRAMEKAREIVLRTSGNMRLEDQEVSKERLEKAIKMKAAEFKSKIPRSLWD
jgi:predicted DNA-binding mobile mystery protein A